MNNDWDDYTEYCDELKTKYHRVEECNKLLVQQNDDMRAALEEIKKGEGPYSQDRLAHAENTINHLVLIAIS